MHDTRLYSIGLAVHLDNACFDSEAGFGGGVLYARFGSIITVEDSTFIGGGRKFYLGGQIIIHCARSAREIFGPRPLN